MIAITTSLILTIVIYSAAATFTIVLLIRKLSNRNRKYIHWKNEKIHVFKIYDVEYERNDDILLNELFSENIRLEAEVKALKKDTTNLSIILLILLMLKVIENNVKELLSHKVTPETRQKTTGRT